MQPVLQLFSVRSFQKKTYSQLFQSISINYIQMFSKKCGSKLVNPHTCDCNVPDGHPQAQIQRHGGTRRERRAAGLGPSLMASDPRGDLSNCTLKTAKKDHVYHMYIICIHHMYIICISYVYHMYIICISYVYHMHIICISYVYHMYIICIYCGYIAYIYI